MDVYYVYLTQILHTIISAKQVTVYWKQITEYLAVETGGGVRGKKPRNLFNKTCLRKNVVTPSPK